MLWPGYVGYHRANSPIQGGVYIGDGLKNLDLAFMLWLKFNKTDNFLYLKLLNK